MWPWIVTSWIWCYYGLCSHFGLWFVRFMWHLDSIWSNSLNWRFYFIFKCKLNLKSSSRHHIKLSPFFQIFTQTSFYHGDNCGLYPRCSNLHYNLICHHHLRLTFDKNDLPVTVVIFVITSSTTIIIVQPSINHYVDLGLHRQ